MMFYIYVLELNKVIIVFGLDNDKNIDLKV